MTADSIWQIVRYILIALGSFVTAKGWADESIRHHDNETLYLVDHRTRLSRTALGRDHALRRSAHWAVSPSAVIDGGAPSPASLVFVDGETQQIDTHFRKLKSPAIADGTSSLAASTSVVCSAARLDERQILCASLAAHLIGLCFKRNLLTFTESGQAGALNRADMHEHIVAAVVRLDETKALLAIEPFHDTCSHNFSPRAHALIVPRDLRAG